MATLTGPTVHDLTPDDARALLARANVGRLAFTRHDRVDIEPISYVTDGEWIFGRTSKGAKLSTLLHHPWCAFEADEVKSAFEWTSVVARGSVHLLDPESGSPDTYGRALDAMRSIVPQTFADDDPAPHRSILLGVFIQEIEGRQALGAPA